MKRWNETILATFKQESFERLEALDSLLVTFEQTPSDREVRSEIGRHVHTLKGSAKLLGVAPMAELAHRMEDVLGALADGRLEPRPALFTALLDALDAAKAMVEAFAADQPVATYSGALLELLGGGPAQTQAVAAPAALAAEAPPARPTPPPEEPPRASARPAAKAKPRARGETVPGPGGEQRPEAKIKRSLAPPQRPEQTPKAKGSGSREGTRRAQTLRADVHKLDTTMNLVGEAVIGHAKSESQLRRSGELVRQAELARQAALGLREQLLGARDTTGGGQLDAAVEAATALAGDLKLLRTGLRELRIQQDADLLANKLLLQALHREVAEIRMLPVSTLFDRFPRAMRDLAQEHGKGVDLEILGGDTRLDQKVLENIEAPLVHILRNAVDHGLEPPDERRAHGKPERGRIRLAAAQEGGRILLRVEDDGRGMDPAALKETAVRRGLLTTAEVEAMSDREAPYLVCISGFSTAKEISDVSGRGIGMDVVARTVEDCKGELAIDSQLGLGTTISIRLPLSLAVTQVLTLECDGQTYCIPTSSVEIVRMVAPSEVLLLADRPVLKLGRRTVPLVHLSAVLASSESAPLLAGEKLSVVLLSHARQRLALVVDRLLEVQEIVIKSLGRALRNLPNVAGATILGTGDVSVVLHAPDLVKHGLGLVGKRVPLAVTGGDARAWVADRPILVVEDSLTTREMVRDILASAGYPVDTAVDGRDGLEKARAKKYGLVLADLQMPVMDGFEMIASLRKSKEHAMTPVVILSSLGGDDDRRRGLEVGADAYLVKAQFGPELLLDAVQRFLGRPPTVGRKRRSRAR